MKEAAEESNPCSMMPEEGTRARQRSALKQQSHPHPLSHALLLTDQLGSEAAAGPAAGREAGHATQHQHPL